MKIEKVIRSFQYNPKKFVGI